MAIPRFSPRLIVQGDVREVTRRNYTDQATGSVEYRGRKVILQTPRGFIEVNLSVDQEHIEPVMDDTVLWWVELSEWNMNGRGGSTLAFSADVSPADLDKLAGLVTA